MAPERPTRRPLRAPSLRGFLRVSSLGLVALSVTNGGGGPRGDQAEAQRLRSCLEEETRRADTLSQQLSQQRAEVPRAPPPLRPPRRRLFGHLASCGLCARIPALRPTYAVGHPPDRPLLSSERSSHVPAEIHPFPPPDRPLIPPSHLWIVPRFPPPSHPPPHQTD